ncbi:helix-hairpin-helix domain-containing protein [Geomicrobium sp. JSM 1781026]|uniref:helix-hairpin-helix domain-containing protein n=1 Tax=Geomicrobium sp. JSM 1781026 TaxID=3344580 RepID=UPI0035C119F3
MKLPLSEEEKRQLRKAKRRIADVSSIPTAELADMLHISKERAKELKALSQFQQIPSIGYQLAEKLVYQLRIYSLQEMQTADPAILLNELELRLGVWTDPCVEDQIRCVVHHANNSNSEKQWHDFTSIRKQYRTEHGYPANRPQTAWYDSVGRKDER